MYDRAGCLNPGRGCLNADVIQPATRFPGDQLLKGGCTRRCRHDDREYPLHAAHHHHGERAAEVAAPARLRDTPVRALSGGYVQDHSVVPATDRESPISHGDRPSFGATGRDRTFGKPPIATLERSRRSVGRSVGRSCVFVDSALRYASIRCRHSVRIAVE